MSRTTKHLQYMEQRSRHARHFQMNLNRMYEEKLQQQLIYLSNERYKNIQQVKLNKYIEQKRKQALDLTIERIRSDRKSNFLSKNTTLPKINENIENYPSHRSQTTDYTENTFKTEENSSNDNGTVISGRSLLEELLVQMKEKNFESNHRQVTLNLHNQNHLANRYGHFKNIKERLDQESRLLQQQLANNKQFQYDKEYQYKLKQAIQRHLKVSAKFCT